MTLASKTHFLKGLKILITRPTSQAAGLQSRIIELGGHPILFPTIDITDPLNKEISIQAMQNLHYYNLAIFISPISASKTFEILQGQWPETLKVAAVGSGTARCLQHLGWSVHYVPSQTFGAKGLLALPAFQQLTGQKILLFQGENGKTELAATLRLRGAEVNVANLYRRTLPVTNLTILEPYALKDKKLAFSIDVITITSQLGLRNLLTLFPETYHNWLKNILLLVTSPSQACYAHYLGFKKILEAGNATDSTIIQTLIDAWSSKTFHPSSWLE